MHVIPMAFVMTSADDDTLLLQSNNWADLKVRQLGYRQTFVKYSTDDISNITSVRAVSV